MRVTGLDGREYVWGLAGHVPLGSEEAGSSYHCRCRELLKQLFPLDQRLEEVPLPGSGGLTADFFLPSRRVIIEVNGPQHYEFSLHFHKTRLGFLRAKANDARKREWAELNGITMVELRYDESDSEWAEQILHRGEGH